MKRTIITFTAIIEGEPTEEQIQAIGYELDLTMRNSKEWLEKNKLKLFSTDLDYEV